MQVLSGWFVSMPATGTLLQANARRHGGVAGGRSALTGGTPASTLGFMPTVAVSTNSVSCAPTSRARPTSRSRLAQESTSGTPRHPPSLDQVSVRSLPLGVHMGDHIGDQLGAPVRTPPPTADVRAGQRVCRGFRWSPRLAWPKHMSNVGVGCGAGSQRKRPLEGDRGVQRECRASSVWPGALHGSCTGPPSGVVAADGAAAACSGRQRVSLPGGRATGDTHVARGSGDQNLTRAGARRRYRTSPASPNP